MDAWLQIDVLRERFRLIVGTALAVTLLTFIALSVLPRTYEAETRLLVGDIVGAQDPTIDDLLLGQQLASTYSVMVTTRPLAQRVIDELGLATEPELLLRNVSARPGLDTPYVTLTVRAPNADLAASIANEFARQLELLAPLESAPDDPTGARSLLTIVEPAVAPLEPASPRMVLFTALSAIAGIALGVALAFLREFRQPRVRSAAHVTSLTGLRTLAVVPRYGRGRRARDLWNDLRAEFLALRTNLIAVNDAKEPKTILVTAARAGEGASMVAQGLAVAWAAAGSRVVLVDRTERATDDAAAQGAGGEPTLTATRNPKIHLVEDGTAPLGTASRKEQANLTAMLSRIGRDADVVIIHGGPVLGGISAISLGASVDIAVLVVDLHSALRRDLELASTSLIGGGVNLAGIVANRPPMSPWADVVETESPYAPAISRIGSDRRAAPTPGHAGANRQ